VFWLAGQLGPSCRVRTKPEPAGRSLSPHLVSRRRRGQTGQVHNSMFNFGSDGELKWSFDGGALLKGETDGSSYMNGGLRVRH
jgi:hypothetical protein